MYKISSLRNQYPSYLELKNVNTVQQFFFINKDMLIS